MINVGIQAYKNVFENRPIRISLSKINLYTDESQSILFQGLSLFVKQSNWLCALSFLFALIFFWTKTSFLLCYSNIHLSNQVHCPGLMTSVVPKKRINYLFFSLKIPDLTECRSTPLALILNQFYSVQQWEFWQMPFQHFCSWASLHWTWPSVSLWPHQSSCVALNVSKLSADFNVLKLSKQAELV